MLIDTNTYCEIIIKILCCWINVSYIFVQICGQAIASPAHDLACSFIYFFCCGVLIIKYNWKRFVIIRNNPGFNAPFFPFFFLYVIEVYQLHTSFPSRHYVWNRLNKAPDVNLGYNFFLQHTSVGLLISWKFRFRFILWIMLHFYDFKRFTF